MLRQHNKVSAQQSTAQGHTCAINRFDEETVIVPFNENELRRRMHLWQAGMSKLAATGDYPEKQQDEQTLYNLQTALWMLSRKDGK